MVEVEESTGTTESRDKAVPLQAWSGPEGSRNLRFPDFMTTAQEGGKFVSPTHRPHYCNKRVNIKLYYNIRVLGDQMYKMYKTCVEKKNQLDVTECFIALMIRSTCFGHFYAHQQELETICVFLPPMVCSAWLLVVGG